MAKFIYEVVDGIDLVVACNSRTQAISIAMRKRSYRWERWILLEPMDYVEPHRHAGEYLFEGEFENFVQNEQLTYRLCPWGGHATLIAEDEKYSLYRTNRYKGERQEGFYLVDNNSKLK